MQQAERQSCLSMTALNDKSGDYVETDIAKQNSDLGETELLCKKPGQAEPRL